MDCYGELYRATCVVCGSRISSSTVSMCVCVCVVCVSVVLCVFVCACAYNVSLVFACIHAQTNKKQYPPDLKRHCPHTVLCM